MDRVRQELRRPAVWLIPLVVLAIQLVGSNGPRHRAGHALHWAPLNWFGYLLLVAGPVEVRTSHFIVDLPRCAGSTVS